MTQVKHAALAEHHVIVEFLTKPFPELERQLVELGCFIPEIVRANNGGIAGCVTTTQIAFLDHCDIGNAMDFGKVVGCGQTMSATTYNNHIVVVFGLGAAPQFLPVFMVAQGVFKQAKARVLFH